ncbi:hypothetical protein KAK06_00885 [Ideonella sp. 4Y11]|uniref:Contractile injection system tube protein N-terminal domain-containing protein n=1 Tax=Ideonella aquatica TaxID=2824119 RepID=A0A940YC81_9BURK|nr:hypothetical protein [Ideonella aquatica]MBQ0957500.1 hypothetical protein [Ideonella aquatica]
MTGLTKAYLAELGAGESTDEVGGTQVPVQFNPGSLRVQIANRSAGGQQAGAQARQRAGTGEMQVSFDLVFDTADEAPQGSPARSVNVLDKTKAVERFVRPRGPGAGQESPPRVAFVWGGFQVQGIMESANIDLDFFDAEGVPLRAKVAVTIKGQDPSYRYTPASGQAGGSTRNPSGQRPPTRDRDLPPGAPGTSGSGAAAQRVVQALPGESLAQLAARNGLSPQDWRLLGQGIGQAVQQGLGGGAPAGLTAPQGIGQAVHQALREVAVPPASAGGASGRSAQGRDPARTTAGLPLTTTAPRRSADGPTRQGQALAQQGGLGAVIDQQRHSGHQSQAGQRLGAFGLDGTATADVSDRPWAQGVPMRPRIGSGDTAAGPRAQRPAGQAPASAFARGSAAASATPTTTPPARRSACGCGSRRR